MSTIILASQSTRRRELLAQMGVTFKIMPSNFDEQLDDARPAGIVATELALGKAMAVAKFHPDAIVIGSDSIVSIDGKQLEKPRDNAEALEMLKLLAGNVNEVSCGLAVVRLSDATELIGVESSRVFFKPYDEKIARAYVETGDSLDKAGGYGIQSGAGQLIGYIEGHYDAIIGLPTLLLSDFLSRLGVEAKAVELTPPVEQRLY